LDRSKKRVKSIMSMKSKGTRNQTRPKKTNQKSIEGKKLCLGTKGGNLLQPGGPKTKGVKRVYRLQSKNKS